MNLNLRDKVAIVTGGAAGIGKGIVQCLIQEGARVVIADWNEEDGQRTCEEICVSGGQAIFVRTNVAVEEDMDHVIGQALDTWGQIDVLVNNVGTHFYRMAVDISMEDWDRMIATDLRGHFFMTQKVMRHMTARGSGSIVQISSVHTWMTRPKFSAYAAAKGGIVAMSRALALECAPHGVRVNVVLPGLTRTKNMDKTLAGMNEEERRQYLKKASYNIPLGRVADPQDIGRSVVFLASEQASFITGACLAVDGGETIHLDW